MAAMATFAILVIAGLAIDLGRFFVVRAQLSKAVDGSALAGARVLPKGKGQARTAAYECAQMNFSAGFLNTKGHKFRVRIPSIANIGRVAVKGEAQLPMTFMRLVGLNQVTVPAYAEAERRPISIGLVLDNSFSMDPSFAGTDAIAFLREAAEDFVWFFDDNVDQMSLTLFSSGTEVHFRLGHYFQTPVVAKIGGMSAIANTNLSDAFLSAHSELRGDTSPGAFRAVVFFTDGRPTALRDNFSVNGVPVTAVITGDQNPTGGVRSQLYYPDRLHEAITGVRYTAGQFPDGSPRNATNLQNLANSRLLMAANQARSEGIAVYTIGLGNPSHAQWWKQPDADLLIEMANIPVGIDPLTGDAIDNLSFDPNQPRGGFYFAPDAASLNIVFEQVAREIVLRLIN